MKQTLNGSRNATVPPIAQSFTIFQEDIEDYEEFPILPELTLEQLLESLDRSEEDIKAGRVYDAMEHLQELEEKVNKAYHV